MSSPTHEWVDVENFTKDATIIPTPNAEDTYQVTGEGVFDKIMSTVTLHLQAQFDSGRIKGEQFASMYTQLTAKALETSMQLLLQLPLKDKQEELLQAQIESEKAKSDLYERQAKGFDDDAKQKVTKILLDSWSVAFSVAKDDTNLVVPESINKKTIDSLVKDILVDSKLGQDGTGPIDLSSNPFSGQF